MGRLIEKWGYWRFSKRLRKVSQPHRAFVLELLTKGFRPDGMPRPSAVEEDVGLLTSTGSWYDCSARNAVRMNHSDLIKTSASTISTKEDPGRALANMSSYGALGLHSDGKILDEAVAMVRDPRRGGGLHGSHGTPLLYRPPLALDYEAEVAKFLGKEDALAFSSGFQAAQAAVAGLLNSTCHVVADAEVHLCIRQGMTIAGVQKHIYRHNDLDHAERIIKSIRSSSQSRIALIVESVYSMSGSVVDFPRAVELKQQYNLLLMVDESHGLGVMGAQGRGIEECFHMPGTVDVSFGSLGKGLSAAGGYVAASHKVIQCLQLTSSHGFSGTLPPLECARGICVFRHIARQENHDGGQLCRARHVKTISQLLRQRLREEGFDIPTCPMEEETALVPVRVHGCVRLDDVARLIQSMRKRGYSVSVIRGLSHSYACIVRLVAQHWMQTRDVEAFVAVFAEETGALFGGVGGFRRVVGYSLGLSNRDCQEVFKLKDGHKYSVSRIGCNGNAYLMDTLVSQELETSKAKYGLSHAIGLGGMNISIHTGWGSYKLFNALRLFPRIARALSCPDTGYKLCDGAMFQFVAEQHVMQAIPSDWVPPHGTSAYMPEGIGRWGMVQSLLNADYSVTFGDLAIIGVPKNLHSLLAVKLVAKLLLPVVSRLVPFKKVYPMPTLRSVVDDKNFSAGGTKRVPKCIIDGFQSASIIAGDAKVVMECIKSGAPVAGKYVIVNTVTKSDMKFLLEESKAAGVVTSTPYINGRAVGTNMLHALATASSGRALSKAELQHWISQNNFTPKSYQCY